MNKYLSAKTYVFLLFLLSIVCGFSCEFSPGSYLYAELYEVSIDERGLIEAVKEFKEEYRAFSVPESIPLLDGRRDSLDYWYHIYFYDIEKEQVLKTWVRGNEDGSSTFALVAVYDSNFSERWKFVNKDFSRPEDKLIKEKFEIQILNLVKDRISQ